MAAWDDETASFTATSHVLKDRMASALANDISNAEAQNATIRGTYSKGIAERARSEMNGLFEAAVDTYDGHLKNLTQIIDSPEDHRSQEGFRKLSVYMNTATKKLVQSRQITFGSHSKSSGTGNLKLGRLTVDPWGYDAESVDLGTINTECVAARSDGAEPWQPKLRLDMGFSHGDKLSDPGPVGFGYVDGLCGSTYLNSASFEDAPEIPASSGGYTIGSWTSNTEVVTANFSLVETAAGAYRVSPDEGDAPKQLVVEVASGGCILTQELDFEFAWWIPWFLAVPYYVAGAGATGTLKIRLGTTEATVSLTGKSGWNVLELAFDENLYPMNFSENTTITDTGESTTIEVGTCVDIELDTLAGEDVILDDVQCGPMTWWNGSAWVLYSDQASPTDLNTDYRGSISNALSGSEAYNQACLHRCIGRDMDGWGSSIPSHASSPTWAEPA